MRKDIKSCFIRDKSFLRSMNTAKKNYAKRENIVEVILKVASDPFSSFFSRVLDTLIGKLSEKRFHHLLVNHVKRFEISVYLPAANIWKRSTMPELKVFFFIRKVLMLFLAQSLHLHGIILKKRSVVEPSDH